MYWGLVLQRILSFFFPAQASSSHRSLWENMPRWCHSLAQQLKWKPNSVKCYDVGKPVAFSTGITNKLLDSWFLCSCKNIQSLCLFGSILDPGASQRLRQLVPIFTFEPWQTCKPSVPAGMFFRVQALVLRFLYHVLFRWLFTSLGPDVRQMSTKED